MRRVGLGLLAAGLLFAPGYVRAQELAKDRTRLQGDWVVLAAFKNGHEGTGPLALRRLHVEGDSFSAKVVFDGRFHTVEGTFKLEAAKSEEPKRIEVTLNDCPLEGNVLNGVYEFDGHNLRLGLALPGSKERPSTLHSPPGSHVTVLTLGRLKQE